MPNCKDGEVLKARTTFTLQSLRYALLVVDHLSFRKGALVAGIHQSVVSRGIRLLEDTIGVSIFERHSGGVRLTNAGVDFVARICQALSDIDAAIAFAGAAGRGRTGRLWSVFTDLFLRVNCVTNCSTMSSAFLRWPLAYWSVPSGFLRGRSASCGG
jgi:hypothetical protein